MGSWRDSVKEVTAPSWRDSIQEIQEIPSPLESGIGGVVQGGLYDFGDEIAGGAGGLWDLATKGDFNYTENRDKAREYFKSLQQANPTSYTAGSVAGAIFSPASKVLGAVGGISKLGKFANMPKYALEGSVFGLGASEGKNLGELAQDTALGAVVGGVGGVGLEKVTRGIGKSYKTVNDYVRNPENQKNALIKAVTLVGDMPKEWAESIAKDPDMYARFNKTPSTVDELSMTVAEKINVLRRDTDLLYSDLDDILHDQRTIHYPAIKSELTKFKNYWNKNPRGISGKKLERLIDSFETRLEYRVEQFQNGVTWAKHKKKISPKVLRTVLLDLGEEIVEASATSLKTTPDVAFMQGLNKKLREWTTNQMLKDPKIGLKYGELMQKAAKNESLWFELATKFKLKKPTFVDFVEGIENTSKRANLEPTNMTETVLKRYPEKNIKLYKAVDKLDKSFKKELEVFGISNRTEGGVARGSRNVQAFSKAGGLVGAGLGGGTGFVTGGGLGGGLGAAVGYGIGKTLGAGVGYLADKVGRKVAKKFLIEYVPKVGGASKLNNKIDSLSPENLDELAKFIKNGNGAAVSALLMN